MSGLCLTKLTEAALNKIQLLQHEISRLDVNIAAVIEVRHAEEGIFQNFGDVFNIFFVWDVIISHSGEGFIVKKSIAS